MERKQPNLEVPKNVTTEAGLYTELLKTNRGVTIAEDHGSTRALKALADNMQTFKKSGVDTVYLEMGRDAVGIYNSMSLDTLKRARENLPNLEKLNPEMYKDYKAQMEKISKETYGGHVSAKVLMDRTLAGFDVAIAARENNIRLKSFENTEAEMNAQADKGMSGRIEQTNKDWTKAIEKDRKEVDPKGQHKFVVMGGNLHFTNTVEGNGTVAQQLGTPVVGYTKSLLPESFYKHEFYKGNNPNGADFYFRSGPGERNLKEFVLPKDTPREAAKPKDDSGKEVKLLKPTAALAPADETQRLAETEKQKEAEKQKAKALAENHPDVAKASKNIQQNNTPALAHNPAAESNPAIATRNNQPQPTTTRTV